MVLLQNHFLHHKIFLKPNIAFAQTNYFLLFACVNPPQIIEKPKFMDFVIVIVIVSDGTCL